MPLSCHISGGLGIHPVFQEQKLFMKMIDGGTAVRFENFCISMNFRMYTRMINKPFPVFRIGHPF